MFLRSIFASFILCYAYPCLFKHVSHTKGIAIATLDVWSSAGKSECSNVTHLVSAGFPTIINVDSPKTEGPEGQRSPELKLDLT